jgi:hypothetical protein
MNASKYTYAYLNFIIFIIFIAFNMVHQLLCLSQTLKSTVQTVPWSSYHPPQVVDLLRYMTPCVLRSNYQQLQETCSFHLQGHFYHTSSDSRFFGEFIKHIQSIRCHGCLHFHSHTVLYRLMAPDWAATSQTANQMLFSHQVIITCLTL